MPPKVSITTYCVKLQLLSHSSASIISNVTVTLAIIMHYFISYVRSVAGAAVHSYVGEYRYACP
jgi:ribosome-associated toxin RatA of RatAB toxin-antitoxin module